MRIATLNGAQPQDQIAITLKQHFGRVLGSSQLRLGVIWAVSNVNLGGKDKKFLATLPKAPFQIFGYIRFRLVVFVINIFSGFVKSEFYKMKLDYFS